MLALQSTEDNDIQEGLAYNPKLVSREAKGRTLKELL